MTKVEKEAKLYENVSDSKLKRVILNYKFLSLSNTKNFNFIITLIFILIPYFILCKITVFSLFLVILSHYFIFCKFLYEKKKWKMVSDEDKIEIDEIIKILESYKEQRKTPK
jgi:hypothetical protein